MKKKISQNFETSMFFCNIVPTHTYVQINVLAKKKKTKRGIIAKLLKMKDRKGKERGKG